jgi:hypothetical protein
MDTGYRLLLLVVISVVEKRRDAAALFFLSLRVFPVLSTIKLKMSPTVRDVMPESHQIEDQMMMSRTKKDLS